MKRPIIVVAVEDEGDEDDPHRATRSQMGHPVPGHQGWDPGKWNSELRENEELRPGRNSPSFEAATGRRTNRGSVSPAYGFSALALVKCSNEEGPGPRHNTKEDPGTSSLVMKGEHEQDVPCDPGQVTTILGRTCPPLLPPPPGQAGQNTLTPPFRGHPPPPVPVPLEERLGESTVRPRVQDQKPWDRQEEDEEAIVSFSADF
jgi:hypothetical protein